MTSVSNVPVLLPNGLVLETSPASLNNVQDISIDSRMSDPLNVDTSATVYQNTQETKFHKDSLVFAKISGHSDPPWPARVAKVCWTNGTHCGYEVFFYGTYQVGIVLTDKIWAYNEEFIAKFSKPKMSAKRKVDFSKGLVEIRDCPDIAPSRDVPESASQIAKKLMSRTAIKDDLKTKGKATYRKSTYSGTTWKSPSAMTGIKKVGDKLKNKSYKKLVYDKSTDDDCDEDHPIKKKRTLSTNDDGLSSVSESNNNNRRSNRNKKSPYWTRVEVNNNDVSQIDPYSIEHLDKYIKPSASSGSFAQNKRKSVTNVNGQKNNTKVGNNVKMEKMVSKAKNAIIPKRRLRENENCVSTGNVNRCNINKTSLKADCVIVKEEPASENPGEWTVAQTFASIIKMDPTLTPEDIKAIRDQKIDGRVLLKLTFHDFVTYCQVKVGPAVKLTILVKELKAKALACSNKSTMPMPCF